ncbi:hypothetical protein J1N35_044238 [Gossypium stocksii]|uniref:Uncharacterized protein n=1 Tax=Gossypium stocksii TaxID=47602 RepID=A0A9D3U8V5_9ROSI|nr:hypothetical protein J1N35_044238 [Gossypium stocksii]
MSGKDMPRPSWPASTSSPPPEAPQTFLDMLEKQYVKKHDVVLNKALQNNLTKAMLTFPLFPKELLSNDEEDDEKPATTHKHTKDPMKDEEPIDYFYANHYYQNTTIQGTNDRPRT